MLELVLNWIIWMVIVDVQLNTVVFIVKHLSSDLKVAIRILGKRGRKSNSRSFSTFRIRFLSSKNGGTCVLLDNNQGEEWNWFERLGCFKRWNRSLLWWCKTIIDSSDRSRHYSEEKRFLIRWFIWRFVFSTMSMYTCFSWCNMRSIQLCTVWWCNLSRNAGNYLQIVLSICWVTIFVFTCLGYLSW